MKLIYFIISVILIISSSVYSVDPGSISVNTDPSNVDVYLDTIYQGVSPLNIANVPRGNHTLGFSKEGYNSAVLNIFVESNINFETYVTLTPGSGTGGVNSGNIAIVTSPSGASLYLNSLYQGTSPTSIENVAVGTHLLRISLENYTEVNQYVEVSPGQTTSVFVNLVSTNENPQTGNLHVVTNPTAANIYLNNNLIGSSPLLINNIATGYQYVRITKDGYNDYLDSVLIYSGLTSEINIQLSQYVPPVIDNSTNTSQGDNNTGNPASTGLPPGATPDDVNTDQDLNPNIPTEDPESVNIDTNEENQLNDLQGIFRSPTNAKSFFTWIGLIISIILGTLLIYFFVFRKK